MRILLNKVHLTLSLVKECVYDLNKCSRLVNILESCQTPGPLGMEDNRISNYQLSASSEYGGLEKHLGRLNGQACWGANHKDMNQWYQVDFTTTVRLLEIHTQGRPINNGNQWVKQYTVSYGYRPDRIDSQFYQQDGQTKV